MGDAPAPLTAARLAEIEGRVQAATPGPWTVKRSGVVAEKETGDLICALGFRVRAGTTEDDDNASLIAHARTDIPALLSEVRRLREALGKRPCADGGLDRWTVSECIAAGECDCGARAALGEASNG